MQCTGQCRCGDIKIQVTAAIESRELQPRVCDCDYCQQHPAAIISHPSMVMTLLSPLVQLHMDKNGDQLAGFYRCPNCRELIFVGCSIEGVLRGAVNVNLLQAQFGEAIAISPKKLTPEQKLERWRGLWGPIEQATPG